MTGKKVSIGARPTKPAADADAWVATRGEPENSTGNEVPAEKMKRLTIDIPASLHRQIKADCAQRETTIADEVRALLLQKYGKS